MLMIIDGASQTALSLEHFRRHDFILYDTFAGITPYDAILIAEEFSCRVNDIYQIRYDASRKYGRALLAIRGRRI